MSPGAAEVIAMLGMRPYPEGGHYVETWRADTVDGRRPSGTAIYYLLQQDEVSYWHRVDASEIWHWYDGALLELSMSPDGQTCACHMLGRDLVSGERPQIVVPALVWQSARTLGAWTLVGCTVSPGFEFKGFEMAPPGWAPASGKART